MAGLSGCGALVLYAVVRDDATVLPTRLRTSMQTLARIGIVTISDRASRGEYEDRGGPAIREYLTDVLTSPFEAVPRVIADEQPLIEAALRQLCDDEHCCLVVTTGGTGPAPATSLPRRRSP